MLKKHLACSPLTTTSHFQLMPSGLWLMLILLLATPAPSFADGPGEIYPIVLDERAPRRGMIELKVELTEPKPISTGRVTLAVDQGDQGPLGSVVGVALFSPAGDVSGAAVVSGNQLHLSFISPEGRFGTNEYSPIIAVSIPVRPDARVGATAQLVLDPNRSWWVAPSGQRYVQQVMSGVFTVDGSVSIGNVVPGSAFVRAGSTVTVSGIGFQQQARVQIDDVRIAATRYVSPTRLDVVLAEHSRMHGKRVQVTNPDRSSATYYSYLRAAPLGRSEQPLLAATFPIFSPRTFTQAIFVPVIDGDRFMGLGFQNPNAESARIAVQLFSARRELISSIDFSLPADMRISREVFELLHVTPTLGNYLRVLSSVPLQMIGLIGDDAEGSVVPLDPLLVDEEE